MTHFVSTVIAAETPENQMKKIFIAQLLVALWACALINTSCLKDEDVAGEGEGEGENAILSQIAVAYSELFMTCEFVTRSEPQLETQSPEYYALTYEALLSRPHITLENSVAADCLAALNANDCDIISGANQVCNEMLVGSLEEGDICGSGECGSGLDCNRGTECGVCEPVAGLGEDCSLDRCENGFICNNNVCEVAAPGIQAGDACEFQCGFGNFDGLACVDQVCVEIEIVDLGGTCGTPDLYCRDLQSLTNCVDNVCTLRPEVGEACSDGIQCENGSFCDIDTQICVEYSQIGESCEERACDFFLARCNFDTSVCEALPGEGETCTDSFCTEGTFCGSRGTCESFDDPSSRLICEESR